MVPRGDERIVKNRRFSWFYVEISLTPIHCYMALENTFFLTISSLYFIFAYFLISDLKLDSHSRSITCLPYFQDPSLFTCAYSPTSQGKSIQLNLYQTASEFLIFFLIFCYRFHISLLASEFCFRHKKNLLFSTH